MHILANTFFKKDNKNSQLSIMSTCKNIKCKAILFNLSKTWVFFFKRYNSQSNNFTPKMPKGTLLILITNIKNIIIQFTKTHLVKSIHCNMHL